MVDAGYLLNFKKNGDGVDFARFLEIIGVEIVRFVILALAFAKGLPRLNTLFVSLGSWRERWLPHHSIQPKLNFKICGYYNRFHSTILLDQINYPVSRHCI